jgi:hypothetical protein
MEALDKAEDNLSASVRAARATMHNLTIRLTADQRQEIADACALLVPDDAPSWTAAPSIGEFIRRAALTRAFDVKARAKLRAVQDAHEGVTLITGLSGDDPAHTAGIADALEAERRGLDQ